MSAVASEFSCSSPTLHGGVLSIGGLAIVMRKVIAVRQRTKGLSIVGSTFVFDGGQTIDTILSLSEATDFLRMHQEAQVSTG